MKLSTLGDTSHDFLQVLIQEFTLTRKPVGCKMELNISNNLKVIRESSNKMEVHDEYSLGLGRESLLNELNQFETNTDILSYRFRFPNYTLRYANGGVLPILKIEKKDYFCFFLRCVFPVGWNIANGASNNLNDIYYPEQVVKREFLEELIFVDHDKHILYSTDTDPDKYKTGTYLEALELWSKKHISRNIQKYDRQPLPIKWFNGPDSLQIKSENKTTNSEGIFLNITPEDNAIEIDKLAIINLKGSFSILDGEVVEKSGFLINRIIGLFEADNFIKKFNSGAREFFPDKVFHNGEEQNTSEIKNLLEKVYFPSHRNAGIRTKKQDEYYEKTILKFDLCPITRSLTKNYQYWSENLNNGKNTKPSSQGHFKVFISYKSEDSDIAFVLYNLLESRGISTFCSGKTIQMMGESDYASTIDSALEQAQLLLVLGTQKEYFHSGWISFEWGSFLNEIRSGRKPNAKVFTLTQDISTDDLPYALRNIQNIPFKQNMLSELLNNLLFYIKADSTK